MEQNKNKFRPLIPWLKFLGFITSVFAFITLAMNNPSWAQTITGFIAVSIWTILIMANLFYWKFNGYAITIATLILCCSGFLTLPRQHNVCVLGNRSTQTEDWFLTCWPFVNAKCIKTDQSFYNLKVPLDSINGEAVIAYVSGKFALDIGQPQQIIKLAKLSSNPQQMIRDSLSLWLTNLTQAVYAKPDSLIRQLGAKDTTVADQYTMATKLSQCQTDVFFVPDAQSNAILNRLPIKFRDKPAIHIVFDP
jgi:hypothetical protein